MNLKEQVLHILETRKGSYISGAELAKETLVSRSAVWKVIKTLQNEGYTIEAVTNKGYCLSEQNDMLSAQSIAKYLGTQADVFTLDVRKSVPSTNDTARLAAEAGCPEGTVVLAEEQTAGKGRLNRSFYSPSGTGIYLSLVLRPRMAAGDALLITTAAAVAVAQTIEKVTGCTAKIKWVNDIYCHDRKVSGILTEASLNLENGEMDYAILGIGINVREPVTGFPSELSTIAGAILKHDSELIDVRSRLAAEVLMRFWGFYRNIHEKPFLAEYQRRSFLPGCRVMVHGSTQSREALALAVDDDCHLVVKYADGSVQSLSSGEVSVRKIEGEK